MMILKAPIELKNRTDFVKDHGAFGERIAGNYMLAGIEMGPEELLHLVSSPPEIYIAEGDMTTVVGNTLISGKNEQKLDIINNMLNRIMLSVDAGLSYQDRVYITDTLHKLGIRDDKRFMNEVRNLMNESRTEQRFIDDYISVSINEASQDLMEETIELSKKILEGDRSGYRQADGETLSRSIMRRLQTGAIYQIVSNFNRSLYETRIELAQQMLSEQENVAKKMLLSSFLTVMEGNFAELIYAGADNKNAQEIAQEEVSGQGGLTEKTLESRQVSSRTKEIQSLRETVLERESVSLSERESTELVHSKAEAKEEPDRISEAPGAIEKEVLHTDRQREIQRIIAESLLQTAREKTGRQDTMIQRDRSEVIYRQEREGSVTEPVSGTDSQRFGARITYVTGNTYERQFINEGAKAGDTVEILSQAALLDVIKNLYNTGYANVRGGDIWMEFRNALYRSFENTVSRMNLTSFESSSSVTGDTSSYSDISMSLDYAEFDELKEIQENEGNIEYIAEQIKQINEINQRNVSRYEQMTNILKKLKPERKAGSGRKRTRKEAFAAIDDSQTLPEITGLIVDGQEERRREVFSEITRLFPENAARVFNVVEQYLNDPGSVTGASVMRANASDAAIDLLRFSQENEAAAAVSGPGRTEPEREELVYKREERLSGEEINEILESYSRRTNRQVSRTGETQDLIETGKTTSTTITQNTERTLSGRQIEDIEDMVARGVRAQMGTISEQVLTKLEKRLRNEKSRRGI